LVDAGVFYISLRLKTSKAMMILVSIKIISHPGGSHPGGSHPGGSHSRSCEDGWHQPVLTRCQ